MPSTSEEPDPLEPAAIATTAPEAAHDPYAPLRDANLRNYLAINLLSIVGMQMQMMALRFDINQTTHEPRLLGLTGLAQVVPVLALMLITGHVVDRFNRKSVMLAALATSGLASVALTTVSLWHGPLLAIYACLMVHGSARAFLQPAKQSFLPQLTEPKQFSIAVTWASGVFHLGSVVGPAIGGWLLSATNSCGLIYGLNAIAIATCLGLLITIHPRPRPPAERREPAAQSLLAGVRFVWQNPLVLGAMTLDMFAVLLGGAAALLPVYATDVLKVGATGFGWMETAPALGSVGMSLLLAHRPPLRKAGHYLLWSVAGFGVCMIVFGLSRSFGLSLLALLLSGVLDTVSVVVRQTLVQLQTPDAMRGRVSAINSVFISLSNELGAFESGETAYWFEKAAPLAIDETDPTPVRIWGVTGSVVSGGIGTLLVVLFTAWKWPMLRRYDRLDAAQERSAEQPPQSAQSEQPQGSQP